MRQQYRWGWYQLVMPHRTTRTPCNMCSVRTTLCLTSALCRMHTRTCLSCTAGKKARGGREGCCGCWCCACCVH